jgi:PAS domain S-box-containing protein
MQLNPTLNPVSSKLAELSHLQKKTRNLGWTEINISIMSEYSSQALDSLPDHIALLDDRGVVLAVNKAWRDFADGNGASSGKSIGVGMNYLEVCEKASTNPSDDANQALAGIKSVIDGRKVNYEFEYACHSPRKQRWFLLRVIPLHRPNRGAVVLHTDITTRVKADLIADESEKRFSLIADAAPVMILMFGPDKHATYCNRRWLDFTGRIREEELGDGWIDSIHPDDRDKCWSRICNNFDARCEFKVSYRLRRHDGEYRWIEDVGAPRYDPSGEFLGYIRCGVDITMDKLAQKAIQELPGRIIDAQEFERRRIAGELHDDIGQRLALLAFDLQLLEYGSQKPPDQRQKKLEELVSAINTLSSDIHKIAYQLHPSKLEQLGLISALKGFLREVREKHDIILELSEEHVPKILPKNTALCVYRVAQEAIWNAVKHSQAKHISIKITGQHDTVCLHVIDIGVGFDPTKDSAKNGLGLVSMKERVRLVGGTISIQSQPSKGTRIDVQVPISSLQVADVHSFPDGS